MNPFRSIDDFLEGVDNTARVIVIEDLDLNLRIGVFEAEKHAPQRVMISVEVLIKPTESRHEDRIDRVISYAAIHDGIAALAERPHVALQETLADEVARICLASEEAVAARVHVRKLDVYADCRSVGIRIVRTKGG